MKILGISAFYHDSAAALVVDGKKKSQEMETGKTAMIFFTAGFGAVRCSDFKPQLDLDTICIPNERS